MGGAVGIGLVEACEVLFHCSKLFLGRAVARGGVAGTSYMQHVGQDG